MKISTVGYIFIILFTLIVLGYLGFAVYSFNANDNQKICNDLDIRFVNTEDIRLINEKDIAVVLENKGLNPIGRNYGHIQTEDIENELLKNPMLKKVECYKTPSGKICIEVLQRTPKFLIAGTENIYVDTERHFFPVSLNYAAYVPIVSGRITKSFATGKLFDFINFLDQNQFWNAQIEQIYVQDDQTIELVPRVGEAVIILGSIDNFEQKLDHLYLLYKQGFNTIGWNLYDTINLEYDNQIVCSKKGMNNTVHNNVPVQKNDSNSIVKL